MSREKFQINGQDIVENAGRVFIKIGSQVLYDEGRGVNERAIDDIVNAVAYFRQEGTEVALVSSGAVAIGKKELGLTEKEVSLAEKQACAAVGQSILIEKYREKFAPLSLVVGQILITNKDLQAKEGLHNLAATFETLLQHNVIPILNENDSVATEEIVTVKGELLFGDNDKLSALLSGALGANLLLLLSNVDGIFEENPAVNPRAKRISRVYSVSELEVETTGNSEMGRGGMKSKIEALTLASKKGVHAIILNGCKKGGLLSFLKGEDLSIGTIVFADKQS